MRRQIRGEPLAGANRPDIASHFTLLLIVVVFEIAPDVNVTVTVPGPFGVDLDAAVLQPVRPCDSLVHG